MRTLLGRLSIALLGIFGLHRDQHRLTVQRRSVASSSAEQLPMLICGAQQPWGSEGLKAA